MLRHISEWLPVPRFEYSGAKPQGLHADHYPLESSSSSRSDFFICVPQVTENDNNFANYDNYYNYYYYYPRKGSTATTPPASVTPSTGRSSDLELEDSAFEEDSPATEFEDLNKELLNGATANICISWQQKHFSRAELERYSDPQYCATPLQRRYQRWTQHQQEQQQQQKRQQQQSDQHVRRRHKAQKTKKPMLMAPTPLSSLGLSEYSLEDADFAARTCLIHTVVHADLVETQTAVELQLEEVPDLMQAGQHLMYVYAQLQQDTLLISLRYCPKERLLYVYPDFTYSPNDLDYVLELNNDCRQLYAYGFQAVSGLQPVEQLQLPSLILELPAPLQQRQLAFQPPPKRMSRVCLLLQLHEGQNFEHANIHVRYYIHPPELTLFEPTNTSDTFPLRGATATCQKGGAEHPARFGHCWQLNFLCEEPRSFHHPLHIYFEVISIDSWQRERCEGYAHFTCPLLAPLPQAVTKGIQLQCSRPVGTWLDALNRRFIGGRSMFDFVGYFNSSMRNTTLHNRLEPEATQAMRNTGTLLFSVQKLQQRQQQQLLYHVPSAEDIDDYYDDDDDDDDQKQRHMKAGSQTLDEVLAAYVEARERIEVLLQKIEL
ncbi:CG15730 [Drosophila busckii]|uniref:CG15730 n=2 Tax=Drosophila busckii TaxID=30019 RepID=A0A0M5J663_DROBS|nr:CG15730 [Drosophila busckii]